MLDDYNWIFVAGIILSFLSAFGLGANDVANAFGTSVGAKSITLCQAIIIAAICEFGGAVLMGGHVTGTIRKGIANVEEFEREPAILMYGMLCVLFATGLWLLLACYLELPVSSTHSVVGGVIGMAIVAHGGGAVLWFEKIDHFPYFKGVSAIVASWFVSPVLAGIVAGSTFLGIYHLILKQDMAVSRQRSLAAFPALVGGTVTIGLSFILWKGMSHLKFKYKGRQSVTVSEVLGGFFGTMALSLGVGIVLGLILQCTFVPRLEKMMEHTAAKSIESEEGEAQGEALGGSMEIMEGEEDKSLLVGPSSTQKDANQSPKRKQSRKNGAKDLHSVIHEDANVEEVHEAVTTFDEATELAFSYLQVFTAMCVSFAHGANDVANSIGPFAAIYTIWRMGSVHTDAHVPTWILAWGGFGIVIGLAIYGHTIIRAVGVKLTKMSPARGFAVELSVAIVIVFGSRYGLPLSTTHCMVGGAVGVGLVQNVRKGINLKLFFRVVMGWIVTMVVVGFTAGAFFAAGVYAPSLNATHAITRYEDGMAKITGDLENVLPKELGTNYSEIANSLLDESGDISSDQLALLTELVDRVKLTCGA